MRFVAWMLVVLGLAAPVSAQGYSRPHAELPSTEQPIRKVPTASYTLSLSWAPEYCHGARGERAADPECRATVQRGGFILHGLWPDGASEGKWPQYCHPVAILTDAQLQAGIGVTPSPQLLQHEWAKHGSCMGDDPVAYFREETRLYRQLSLPDMRGLARNGALTAADITAAFARANPRLPAQAVRVHANKRGWLDEIWLCLDKARRFTPCEAEQGGGASPDMPIRIETGYARPPRPDLTDRR